MPNYCIESGSRRSFHITENWPESFSIFSSHSKGVLSCNEVRSRFLINIIQSDATPPYDHTSLSSLVRGNIPKFVSSLIRVEDVALSKIPLSMQAFNLCVNKISDMS